MSAAFGKANTSFLEQEKRKTLYKIPKSELCFTILYSFRIEERSVSTKKNCIFLRSFNCLEPPNIYGVVL